jgi:type VI secretion system protein ImpK
VSNANPFAETEDDDGTVIVPRSALHPLAEPPPTIWPPAAPSPDGRDGFHDLPPIGLSPIVAAAAPLLTLMSGLRNLLTVPDPASLRERTVAEVQRYEQVLREAKLPLEQIRTSHYAICASIDDVVQNTPWGTRGPWADASLVSTFHQEVRSGERFFELLSRLSQNAGKFLPVIELMYLCMSLGMQGRYRLSPRGPAELDRVREETYLIILRQRGAAEPALSVHWQGVSAPFRRLGAELPVWLAALIAAALLGLACALILLGLNTQSDRLFAAALALPPSSMPAIVRAGPPKPVPPAPQPPGARDALTAFLQPEIHDGLVSVVGTETVPIVRIQSAGMFASGSATLEPGSLRILQRIATALQSKPGPVHIVGYTDNQPIHTVAFPSNFQLSEARAKAAADFLATTIGAARITAEGRADADPIATNATPDGRQQNRRVEIVVDQRGAL